MLIYPGLFFLCCCHSHEDCGVKIFQDIIWESEKKPQCQTGPLLQPNDRSGVVEHLQASQQARCSRQQALIFWCHILTLVALSLLSDNVGSLLSAIFTLSELLWPPDVMKSVLLSYHLQIPSLKKARPRDGH